MIKKLFIHSLFASILLSGCGQEGNNAVSSNEIAIEQIRQQFAPDKRVSIFNVTFDHGILRGETNLPEAKKALVDLLSDAIRGDSLLILKPAFALVNVSVCNIRSQPKHSAELATQSLMGTVLKTYKTNGTWQLVQTPDGYLGWLDQGALVETAPDVLSRWQLAKKVVVKKSFDFIHADQNGSILSDVVEGNILESGDLVKDQRQVKLPDGRQGFITDSSITPYEDFITLKEPLLDNILQTAQHMMGRPYLWGGTSGKGMDCSGFTKTVYYLNALELPRDASQQVNVGMEVDTDTTLRNLSVGDFLFFGNKKTQSQKEKITHVAMYLGDGKIIHASDRIQVQSLKRGDPDFTEKRLLTLVKAKRMLEHIGENGVKKLEEHPLYAY